MADADGDSMKDWSPDSWRSRPYSQEVSYPDQPAFAAALAELSRLPPLVTSWEVETLKAATGRGLPGRAFLLQGGDCCESFSDCRPEPIVSKLKILLKMSLILVYGCKQRVIRVGRFAGQFAKPRSSPHGDPRRGDAPQLPRQPDQPAGFHARPTARPIRMLLLRGYERAALTLEFHPQSRRRRVCRPAASRTLGSRFVNHSEHFGRVPPHHRMRSRRRSVSWRPSPAARSGNWTASKFFVSHEGLHLDWEQAQTRQVPRRPRLVQPEHAFSLDRRPHAGSGCGARRVLSAASPTPSA